MAQRQETRQDDGARPSHNDTQRAQGEAQSPKARQPNERDESADSQAADSASIRDMGEVAHAAATSGQQDTSKAQETDATYHRMRETADPAPVDKRNQNQRGG
jgi:hypothetical protein